MLVIIQLIYSGQPVHKSILPQIVFKVENVSFDAF